MNPGAKFMECKQTLQGTNDPSINAFKWVVAEIYPLRNFNVKLWGKFYEREGRMYERTYLRKDENYIPLGIFCMPEYNCCWNYPTIHGIIQLLYSCDSVNYLSTHKPLGQPARWYEMIYWSIQVLHYSPHTGHLAMLIFFVHIDIYRELRSSLIIPVSNPVYCLQNFTTYVDLQYESSMWGNLIANDTWTASSEFGTYRLCEQRRFRRACASAQSRQNLRCSLIQAVSQEEPSDRKLDLWSLWMAEHAQLKFVMMECSKTQIRLTRPKWHLIAACPSD